MGAQLLDKPVFKIDLDVSVADTVVKALGLARTAGVPVPDIYGRGTISQRGAFQCRLPFLIFGFVPSTTIEDDLLVPTKIYCGEGAQAGSHAPNKEVGRLYKDEVFGPLEAQGPLSVEATAPVCRFETPQNFIDYLRECCREEQVVGADVVAVLDRIEEVCKERLEEPCRPAVLVHQDDHPFNILCSRSGDAGTWRLEAVIDWESAAIVDPRLAYGTEEPWVSLRDCGHVAKGRWLAAAIVRAESDGDWSSVPRCDLSTLRGEHDAASKRLVRKGMLSCHQTWSSVLHRKYN